MCCDGLYQLIKSIGSHWNTSLGSNQSCGPLSDILCRKWPGHVGKLNQKSTHMASSSSYLRVNIGCALAIVFQVRSLQVPPFEVCFRESLVFRLHSEIDKIHLSTEAQCGTACLPMGDCHNMFKIGSKECAIVYFCTCLLTMLLNWVISRKLRQWISFWKLRKKIKQNGLNSPGMSSVWLCPSHNKDDKDGIYCEYHDRSYWHTSRPHCTKNHCFSSLDVISKVINVRNLLFLKNSVIYHSILQLWKN